jgi:hypothetical protein
MPSSACARVYRYQVKGARLLAFERNIDYHMSEELKQAGGSEALQQPLILEAAVVQPSHWYDLRAQTYLGHTNRLHFTLDPWRPSLFAGCPDKHPPETIVQTLMPP